MLEPLTNQKYGKPLGTEETAQYTLSPSVIVLALLLAPLAVSWQVVAVGCAEHCTGVVPVVPVQLQFHGPEPVTEEAVPALHKLLLGAEENVPPFELPHCGTIGVEDTV